MKILPQILFGFMLLLIAGSCKEDDNTWEKYKEWRNANTNFFIDKSNSMVTPNIYEYERVTPTWDKGSYILMKWFKKGAAGSLTPLYTSTVNVTYKGSLYNGTSFDSTYLYTDSLTTLKCSATILGFSIALTKMAVGDSCEIIIPQYLGYGAQELTKINPYSTLIFGMKLRGIPGYEKP
ncbi:MAG: FKBP-type peptidyl-prolyl cis-trans isomerase, partial [Bacteroidales bacterium]